MKEFWLEPRPDLSEDSLRRLIEGAKPDAVILPRRLPWVKNRTAAQELGGEILVVSDPNRVENARKSGTMVALELVIRDKSDHQKALKALDHHPDYLLFDCPDWKIIPLENLIAEARGRSKLLARTGSFEESRIALATLELGVDGIVLSTDDLAEALKTRELLAENRREIALSKATVFRVKPMGTGSRVCVDTCEIIRPNEGLLTGSSSQALFLVEGEVHSNPHVNPRPFRVNAGPVSLYVLTPGGKTRYLSELSAGETVLLVDQKGQTRSVDVARVKIERRPMVLVEAESSKGTFKTILQNAETVRLVTSSGSRPVTELKPGDEVLVRLEEGGRHFGTKIPDEMIIER